MKSNLTVKETAHELDLSESTVRNYLNSKKLELKIIDGKHYVTTKSIKNLNKEKQKSKKTGGDIWSRRAFMATIGVFALSPLYNKVVVDWMADSFGNNAVETDIRDLFSNWNELNLFPGIAHPKYIKGFHPDVAEAQNSISKLMDASGKVEFRPLDQCLKMSLNENYLLIGGPISNELSRTLHGYKVVNQKISENPSQSNDFRWHFNYPESKQTDYKYSRFVNGEERSTMPKAIVDKLAKVGTRKYNLPQIYTENERISTDYLLLTVIENKLSGKSTGKQIIDIADLNGQGNKAFAIIMSDKNRRNQLRKAVNNKPYYQALYEVKVLHDDFNRITSLGEISLINVHLLS